MRIGAYTVVFDADRRVLLCHRRDFDAWNLPGGAVEEDESPWDAAIRETREEVCIDVEIVRLTGVYWKPQKQDLVFNFEGRATGGTPATSDEADEVGWFSIDALPANTAPLQIERIRDALAGGPPVLRTQSGAGIRELFPATARRP
jgi:ADP-ribose pyrophosphatase YjhB (NUDIX family)